MKPITNEFMKRYEGCQMEIMQSHDLSSERHRCQIKKIEVRIDGPAPVLHVEFDYKMLGALGKPWTKVEPTPLDLELAACQWNDIGHGRFAISGRGAQMSVFYPKNHPTRVLEDGTFVKDDN